MTTADNITAMHMLICLDSSFMFVSKISRQGFIAYKHKNFSESNPNIFSIAAVRFLILLSL
ncbi:hypothetical protein GCM10011386_12880 [Parapedobacter defluvii]|uniref:Uncharacterized protein n=1 Tax=Parapedobacter defluvii TaxID=2045106 RepID=A0ABQ1LBR3_9SPHI|nr:hypothetical protein GCM10011386_12880 [Parapedobacter defluvii]